jgi:adsorption protein B
MGQTIVTILSFVHHELLLFAAVGLAIGGIDDLLVDLVYLFRRGWRELAVYTRHPRMTTQTLPASSNSGRIAIFVPAWQEDNVIGNMLRGALRAWGAADYRLFVGVYPNDPATLAAVADVAEGEPRIIIGLNDRPGPTTKGDCLNGLWRAMLAEERLSGQRFKAVVLHDAEDVVHADEIRLFDRMIDRFALVQLPVMPLLGDGGWWSRFITNHYADEFAESHTKTLIVREALGASMPSAGVACAFERERLDALVRPEDTGPFDPASLTEDYELGLRIADQGGRGVFVRMRDASGALVATREYFPDSFEDAVKQKARWMIGISLAGWDRMGWRGGVMEYWMRIRDRRASAAAIVLFAAYLALLLWGALLVLRGVTPVEMPAQGPVLSALLSANVILLGWRLMMRAAFTARFYGWRQGVASLPRLLVANAIAMLAARRAVLRYARSLRGEALRWDKTRHRFPVATT